MSVNKWVCKHKIPSNKQYFDILGDYFYGICIYAGFQRAAAQDMRMALIQALENVRLHAYGGSSEKPIQVEFHRTSGLIEIRIRDYGKKALPGKIKGRPLDRFREGGVGVAFIEGVMDKLQYFTLFKRGNLLVMEKSISGGR